MAFDTPNGEDSVNAMTKESRIDRLEDRLGRLEERLDRLDEGKAERDETNDGIQELGNAVEGIAEFVDKDRPIIRGVSGILDNQRLPDGVSTIRGKEQNEDLRESYD